MVLAYEPGISFDLRFLDTDTGEDDHPWRMNVRIDESRMEMDSRWHHLHVPLSSFREQGAWEAGTWYSPEGKFDWTAIDALQIVSEEGGLDSTSLWFDNIHITDLDTALVENSDVYSDTLISYDTLIVSNILERIDSVVVSIDTITEIDSILFTRLSINTEIITSIDSILLRDTRTFFDMTRFTDTIHFLDTLFLSDTVILTDTIWKWVDTVTSVNAEHPGEGSDIQVFPNPFGTELNISGYGSGSWLIRIYGISGRLLSVACFNRYTRLETGDIPPGMYILHISNDDGYLRRYKILKE
jgi:hypothetical protein